MFKFFELIKYINLVNKHIFINEPYSWWEILLLVYHLWLDKVHRDLKELWDIHNFYDKEIL